ncbi:energy transducer TonB [Rhodosalinus sp. FB01]|uniref:energy transducer TonB family protein n=1 Tax=Rhodosalinus sp. FB01 TaxID=3239194 RepID=UPI0035249C48
MTPRALVLAGAVSAALHLAALGLVLRPEPDAAMAGGGAPVAVARLGDSFADLAAGGAASPPPPAEQTPAEAAPAPQATEADRSEAVAPAGRAPVARQLAAAPAEPEQAPAPARRAAAVPAETAAIAPAARPQEIAATAPAARPQESAQPTRQPSLTPSAPVAERVTGVAPVRVRQASAETPRPRPRPPRQQEPAPSQARAPAATAPAGNAERSARRGDAQGARDAEATRAATVTTSPRAESGRAEAANYGGRVLRQIARTRKERVRARGVAVVGFRIGVSGELVAVSVLRSSGARDLDRAALDHIRRAAPFPAPPRGAPRSFSFEFAGR